MGAKCFDQVLVWQKAHQLALKVYRYAGSFPRREDYCLTSQLQRTTISTPANIAEGFKKKGKADKLHYMNIAQGSLEESRYYLILARDFEYENTDSLLISLEEVNRLLEGYIQGIIKNMGT